VPKDNEYGSLILHKFLALCFIDVFVVLFEINY